MSDPTSVSSDRLSKLKQRAAEFMQRSSAPYRSMSVPIEQLIGLIECAEIVQTDYLLLSDDQRMKALHALKELGL
jgi:hypothetical protein